MSVGRDKLSKALYMAASRDERRDMVRFSQCDTGRAIGLLRAYMANDFGKLAHIRNRRVKSRGETVERKADFYSVLANMAERLDRLKEENNSKN